MFGVCMISNVSQTHKLEESLTTFLMFILSDLRLWVRVSHPQASQLTISLLIRLSQPVILVIRVYSMHSCAAHIPHTFFAAHGWAGGHACNIMAGPLHN